VDIEIIDFDIGQIRCPKCGRANCYDSRVNENYLKCYNCGFEANVELDLNERNFGSNL